MKSPDFVLNVYNMIVHVCNLKVKNDYWQFTLEHFLLVESTIKYNAKILEPKVLEYQGNSVVFSMHSIVWEIVCF